MNLKRRSRLAWIFMLLGCTLLCAALGCGSHTEEHAPASLLSEAQRDTAIARSQIPGAAAVGRALDVAGRESAHSAQLDSLQGH